MRRLRREHRWRAGRDLPFLVLCVAAALGMVPAVRQPSATVSIAGTDVTFVPSDLVFLVLAVLVAGRLLGRARLPEPARAVTLTGAAFAAWLAASSLLNGADAVVGAAKLLEYGVLALGAVLFVQRRTQLWALVSVVVAMTVVATAYAFYEMARYQVERHASFLGPHDYAALSTMALTVGLATLYAPGTGRRALAWTGVVTGTIGVVLGAALASLLGVYLAVAATITIAAARRAVSARAVLVTAGIVAVATAAVIGMRFSDLGLGEEGAQIPQSEQAGSLKYRLVHAYIAGRIFLDNPVVGTGWYGELPPEEYVRHLPDTRERFPDVPAHYFPSPTGTYLPQQTYDQILAELGIVGALLFLALGVAAVRTAVRVGVRWPPGPDAHLAYVPAAWLGSLAGALAGAAFFGGGPLTAIFWLTLGVVAVAPSLLPPPRAEPVRVDRREPVPAGS